MKLQSLTTVVLVAGFSLPALALPTTSSIGSFIDDVSSISTNSTTAGTYTVVSGDTLDSIAAKEDTTTQLLEDANPGVVPTDLLVGEVLILPASAVSSNGTR